MLKRAGGTAPPRWLSKEATVGQGQIRGKGGNPLTRLVSEIGWAARAGWAPTARLIVLLLAVAGALALILVTGR